MQFQAAKSASEEHKVACAPTASETDVSLPPMLECAEFVVSEPAEREIPPFRWITRCGALLPRLPGLQHSLLI